MNKTEFNKLGGFGVVLDDFMFEQVAVREGFTGIMSAFGITEGDPVILSGCAVVGLNYTAGYIYFGSEIFRVDAAVVPAVGGGEALYWVVDETYDSAGLKTMEDSTTADTYVVRRAKMEALAAPPVVGLLVADGKTLAEKIEDIINPDSEWHTVGDVGEPAYLNGWANAVAYYGGGTSTPFRYRKFGGNRVIFDGIIYNPSYDDAGAHYHVFTLPVGYRPSGLVLYIVPQDPRGIGPGPNGITARIEIRTNGEVYSYGVISTAQWVRIWLFGISFFTS